MTHVEFGLPNPNKFKHHGLIGVDMHFHTQYSMDAVSKIEDVLKHCIKFNHGVAISDHTEIKGAVKAFKLKKKQFIIPAMEITTHVGAHLIPYFYHIKELKEFYKKEVMPLKKQNPFFLPIEYIDMIEKLKKYNCVICTPHPFGPGVIGVCKEDVSPKLIKSIDVVEGINGACLHGMNKKAVNWAKKIHKPMTAGTDGHTLPEIAKCLCFSDGHDIESFLNDLKRGKNTIMGREEHIFTDIVNTAIKFIEEEHKEKGKLLKLYEARYKTEHDFLFYKLKKEKDLFAHHFNTHHKHITKKHIGMYKDHKHFKHLIKYLK